MKYYIVAGEKSGDLHAANLMKALSALDKQAEFRGFGGDFMQKAGLELVLHYQKMAFMGFFEVLKQLPAIRKYLALCKKDLLKWQPDVVILVDYAGFNLRIAKFAKKKNIKTFYYISPKIWAWNTGRVKSIKKYIDRMFVILHFEQAFYQRFSYRVDYVGNPLYDEIQKFSPTTDFRPKNNLGDKPIIALLPGSRVQEVTKMLAPMLQISAHFPAYRWCVAGVSSLPSTCYQAAFDQKIPVIYDQTYDLLNNATAALVTSGTATLETALFQVPQVVCYKTGTISYHISKWLIKVPYISLVNLLADKEVVKELIQTEFTPENLKKELELVLTQKKESILREYRLLAQKIATPGASQKAAELMVEALSTA